ncbi:MAG: Ig-like domain-containing protein, partial [Balneolaceae bacterium]
MKTDTPKLRPPFIFPGWLLRFSILSLLVILSGCKNKSGITELGERPVVTSTNPANNASEVDISTPISARFNQDMNPSSFTDKTFILRQDTIPVTGTINYSDSIATFKPSDKLTFGKTYTAKISKEAENLAGVTLDEDLAWSFTTAGEPKPPAVISTSPDNNATNVPVGSSISATFSKPMNPSTINDTTFSVSLMGSTINGNISYSGTKATFTPSSNLNFNSTYSVTITPGVEDQDGNNIANKVTWSFSTPADNTPPQISSTNPADRQKNLPVNTSITVTFSEKMDANSINNNTFILRKGSTGVSGTITYSGNTASFVPSADLDFNSEYSAIITNGVQDLAGNQLENNYSWSFTTGKEPDDTAPRLTSTDPADNETNVAVNTNISATFSESMDPSTINATTFQVTLNGSVVSGTVNYSGTTATFTPASDLEFNSTYAVTVTTGVQDLAGNNMASNVSWSFTTASPPDNTPPQISSTNPADNQKDLPVNTSITVMFSEKMDPSSINNNTFILRKGSTGVSGTITYSGNTASFVPSADLDFSTKYSAIITNGVQDLAGNKLENNYSWSFTTGKEPDNIAPRLTSTDPADNETNVAVNTNISATFSEPMDPSTINSNTFRVSQNGSAVNGSLSYSGSTAIFSPDSDFDFNSTYAVTVTTGVQDLAGNNMASSVSWSFTTASPPDNTPPQISSTNPADNQKDLPINTSITVTFSEDMDPSSINNNTFILRQGSTGISGTISYSSKTASFTPSGDLAFGTTYTAIITSGVKDLAGNSLQNNYSWSFTTGKEPDNTAPQLTSTDPADNETDVAVNANITATFSEPMDPSTVNTTNFIVTKNGTPIPGNVSYFGTTAIFNPTNNLTYGSLYNATITSNMTDVAGNKLEKNTSWTFTTIAETTPPVVTSTSPADNAQDVPINSSISVTFSEPMDPSTIDATTFQVTLDGTSINGSISYSGTTAIFTPVNDLEFGSTYAATVTTGVQDLAGNNMTSNVSWNFTTTQETTPPTVTSTSPVNNAQDVTVGTNISATFSEPMDPSTIDATTFQVTLNGSAVSGTVNYSGTTATFTPASDLEFNSTYAATVTTGVQDLAGNNMTSNVSWNFTTTQETTPPTVTSTSPVNNAQDVAVGTNISATFSEPMDPSTIDATTFQVTLNGSAVSGTVNYSGTTATFTPASDLEFNSTYAVTVTTGVQDLAGNNMTSNVSWNFTTAQETTPPEVISQNPADGATDVPVDIPSIEVTFSEPMNSSTITNTTFSITLNGSSVKGKISYSGEIASFNPDKNLEFGSTYTVTVTTGVQDLAGNNMTSNVSWNFTTAQETTPPTVTSTSPVNNAQDVTVGTNISATFSEPMDPSTIDATTFQVTLNGSAVSGTVNY